jgi:small-conductance mechanosensitive channel/CRP-like cAMP-binding protein
LNLAMTAAPAAVAWGVGIVVAIAGLFVGGFVVKLLARHRVPWWPALIAPAAAFGPGIGLLVGSYLATGTLDSLAFWVQSVDADAAKGVEAVVGATGTARAGWSLLVFFGAVGIYGLVARFLLSRIVTEELGLRIPEVFIDLGRVVLWGAMAFVVVGFIWQRTDFFSALFTVSAVSGAVILFALQDTFKNFISAWTIFGEGVFSIGDWIVVGEDEGEVISITRRTTKIRTRSGDAVTIPNGQVTSGKVRNESRPTPAHAEYIQVQVAYDAPPNRVRDILRRAVLEVPKIVAEPAPRFRLKNFADSGIDYQAKVWIEDLANLHDIMSDLRVQIWYHFQREGIEFPYPVREIRRRSAPSADPSAKARAIHERLKSVPFFDALPEDLFTLLARDAGLIEFGAGERVVQLGEAGDTCYVVDAGRLAVLVSDGPLERQVAQMKPGDLFGEMSLLTGEPRSATVRALEDSRVVSVGSSALRAALERAPELAHRLAEVTTLRREGLLEARAALDASARARVDAGAHRLRELIKRFFKLPEPPTAPAASPSPADVVRPPDVPREGGPGRVAGGPPGP